MKYIDLISKRKQYKYSANLIFDIDDENRLAGFIPNIATTEILREYLYSILESNNDVHSRILYGSYGTGKSHLLTVLSCILGHINTDKNGFNDLCKALSLYDSGFASFLKKYTKEDTPFFIVPIYSDFDQFDKCISFSLKKELNKKGYDIKFKNFYCDALEVLNTWESGSESSEKLKLICYETNINLRNLRKGLENYDNASEKSFDIIFKKMTYGASFKSEDGGMIENIEIANEAIKNSYRGIVFVFDEFGRYVEDCGENIKVKMIQDLAEFCDHSIYDDYLILVSHKQLSLYTEKMRKSIADEWKKVEGRFLATSINIKHNQCLSLVGHIIPKTPKWEIFRKKYNKELEQLYNGSYDFKGFLLTSKEQAEEAFEEVFPLHPITLYSLDRLSKIVAQNERTFFTYLAGDEENTLFYNLENMNSDEFHFVGLDAIYDYFEPNIKTYRSDEVYGIYKKFQYAVNKLESTGDTEIEIEIKILKCIAVIDIVASMSKLIADTKTFLRVIDAPQNRIESAIEHLETLRIIKYMRQYNYYEFLDSSIYDLDAMVEEKLSQITDEMAVTTLNEEFSAFAIYPHEYNFTYHINRIFVPIFVLKENLKKKSFNRGAPAYYDGMLAFVIDREFDENYYINIKEVPDRTILLVGLNSSKMIKEVKRYVAIKYYYSICEELKKEDPTVEKELSLFLDEQSSIISTLIKEWRNADRHRVLIYYNGKRLNVSSTKELSEKASEIMSDTFNKTIIVNNDLVNKNSVTGAIKVARKKVIDCIIDNKNVVDELQRLSPEHSVFRSVLQKNGLYDTEENVLYNILPGTKRKKSGSDIKKVIDKFIEKKAMNGQASFEEIYNILKMPPFGLRDGYISILIANELKVFQNIFLYFHGNERDYCCEELINAIESPKDYTLCIVDWTDEQKEYIETLEKEFSEFINKGARNRLKELYNAMNRHFSGITKAARTTECFVSSEVKKYRNIMNVTSKNYHIFFFETLLEINNDFQELTIAIGNIRRELESVTALQKKSLLNLFRKVFSIQKNKGIVKSIFNNFQNDWVSKKNHTFEYITKVFLDYLDDINYDLDDETFVCDLAKLITGFEIEYWNDNKIDDLEEQLNFILKQLSDYEFHEGVKDGEIRITIQSGSEESKISQFDEHELSNVGQMMFNKMKNTINDFGQSIGQEEKMQVIVQLLSEII